MNAIEKFLRTLSTKEREAVLLVMQQILRDFRKIPGVKRLQGKHDVYRVRMGPYRILFTMRSNGKANIFRITRRNEKTYRGL
ncbi:hypothetical protein A3H22_03970 [Candidatus Peribacteria bacterium RIFCSPLOWO2_12_FULL_55_15]|nr:MAG: hypothetical protein A2789_03755 [Candidatus Peribacteria bacterium RIFCSPHIGHO2_01_FULL_54_22]OGJ63171.1 MAG: hypothetical protein A3D12_03425 [Candidatus Peribacteria bacterium RIFCSPHIGHO2_02_FULL_55_24]OGJ64173.1 MAG: hypothetical protein A3E47_03820 [Candidatus Peribacteria bacterium RIFCSPHIGHO2_12_FULL_54_10]OGJ68271.1 MAG: hypothetical protein A2947_00010 [Candidatus Peribacteria bacterium RIFCSPLOWO2_01_FULL_54_110]OGJ69166.1 MAG: hypothetical protein A3H90_01180 [Candidatus Pe